MHRVLQSREEETLFTRTGLVGEGFPEEMMPEINLEEFAQQEGVEFSKVQQLEWLVGWRGVLGGR